MAADGAPAAGDHLEVTAVFAVMRAVREDWAIAGVLAVVAAVMFAAAALERRSAGH